MNKTLKRFKPYLGYAVALAVLVVGVFGVVEAQQANIFNIENATFGFGGESPGDTALGSGIAPKDGTTNFTTNVAVEGNLSSEATTTIQEVSLGSRFSKALTFTAGATTTPGGLVALQNTGGPKVCYEATFALSSTLGAAFTFSLATSSSATAFSAHTRNAEAGLSRQLIASTSIAATSTKPISTYSDPGSFYTWNGTSASTTPFVWANGEYLIGQFDGAAGTESENYASNPAAAGKLFVNCNTF